MAVKFRHKETGLFWCRAKGRSPSRNEYYELGEESIFRKRHLSSVERFTKPLLKSKNENGLVKNMPMNLKLLKYNVMVRKIKFRGKDIDTGEWRYGYLSFFYTAGRDKNGFILTDKAQIYSQEDGRCYDVLAETVGQFTGLFDKNGKEIYEGDILLMSEDDGCMIYNKVGIKDGCFGYIGEVNGELIPFCHCDVIEEVVGNIFDNPNLLNNEEDNVQ